MALVEYSSSSEEEAQDDPLPEIAAGKTGDLKRKRASITSDLPPLPAMFHDLYASSTRISISDDPSLHGGRKRITPHIQGNWPTHLYIEWYPETAEYDLLCSLINSLQTDTTSGPDVDAKVESLLTSELGTPLPLHISLSRPIGFATEQKDAFLSSLQKKIPCSGVRPFEISLAGLDWVPNFERSRWFLVFRVEKPEGNGLNKLLEACNETVEDFSQPPLYAPPRGESLFPKSYAKAKKYRRSSGDHIARKVREVQDLSAAFHISIGWALEKSRLGAFEQLKLVTNDKISEALGRVSIGVDAVKVKIGNSVTSIDLMANVIERNGLFES